MKVLVVDNFDSFTYNLVQMLGELGAELVVERNDVSLQTLIDHQPDSLVISPGPGRPPDDTGVTCDAIRRFVGKIPILGVCLGHQAIGQVFGGRIVAAKQVMHGKASMVTRYGDSCLLMGPSLARFSAGRYHSLAIERQSLPECLEVLAESDDGEIMAIGHRDLPHVYGVQFHPESVLTASDPTNLKTSEGRLLLTNFLAINVLAL